ncbi:properdin [Dicentrarchus labrax]|uniref:properdin n=1 Tax=Dicentrarchus labrax TaxID=13489 RepID=UPI0021F53762|nr:properdin [Dicentrarchus labrax]XP_051275928.1 properdin [Dicentrarchus labrax]
MEVHSVRRIVVVAVLLLVSVERSECERCFARLNWGQCGEEIGELDIDDCCQNVKYGYQTADGVCHSCGPPQWSEWSPWSYCNVLCGDGVTQRKRTCFAFGLSECENAEDKLQTRPCAGSCCDAKGWGLWLSWSACSVSCGEGGVRKRTRVCSDPPECQSACSGSSEETESCPPLTCPVHGGWSSWSGWSQCSGSCIDDQRGDATPPTKRRYRSCSNPAPSGDTVPHGNSCPGDEVQVQDCSELPNCPVDGSWGAWSPSGTCSVPCGEGLQLAVRKCNQPTPKYGGRFCEGQSTRTSVCENTCPVDGFWSGWSTWSECSSSCIQDRVPVRTRHRSCSNPAPSSSPPGRGCQGDDRQMDNCNNLPHCAVDGGWGSWSAFSSCPVSCGVGLQVSVRECNSPAPNHGGQPCPGDGRRTSICKTDVYCPVDGVWSQWSPWSSCKNPFHKNKRIRCERLSGGQTRERQCLHQNHGGAVCTNGTLTETRACYDVTGCPMKGTWEGWESWSLCTPPCGGTSQRSRRRICDPDYSRYSLTIGPKRVPATFFGTPCAKCKEGPNCGEELETQPCVNAPACT